jgi:hypothetical protein
LGDGDFLSDKLKERVYDVERMPGLGIGGLVGIVEGKLRRMKDPTVDNGWIH